MLKFVWGSPFFAGCIFPSGFWVISFLLLVFFCLKGAETYIKGNISTVTVVDSGRMVWGCMRCLRWWAY